MDTIVLRGARTHNLKNIDLQIPRDKITVITGLSGSGKSSLAFDTLYAEGQRRYVESLSAYARQFLSLMEKPDVDHIEGLSPAIAIDQKTTSHNPRSTVGTITEVYDYLRLLFARAGVPHCPHHQVPLNAQTIGQMCDQLLTYPEDSKWMLIAPIVRDKKGEHLALFQRIKSQGFVRVRIDETLYEIEDLPKLNAKQKHSIGVVVDRFKLNKNNRQRLIESLETTARLSDGLVEALEMDDPKRHLLFSANYACPHCGYNVPELEPRSFSFNNPSGACPTCDGLGVHRLFDPDLVVHQPTLNIPSGAIRGWDRRHPYYFKLLETLAHDLKFDLQTPFQALPKKIQSVILYGTASQNLNDLDFEGVIPNIERRYHQTESTFVQEELSHFIRQQRCPSCQGSRLKESSRHVLIDGHSLPKLTEESIAQLLSLIENVKLSGTRAQIAEKILYEIKQRLRFLIDVGLDYLTLHRSADTLSGGEAQRIRLASQIGAGLVGVMYILDEPSIGLHQRDNGRLLNTLKRLRDLGNTVIVVEHDEEAILTADHIIDMGPGAGIHGGEVVASGSKEDICNAKNSLTGDYLCGRKKISVPVSRKPFDASRVITIKNAHGNNLKNITTQIPLGLFTCITGVSGSGKSTLINHTLAPLAAHQLNGARLLQDLHCEQITGLELLDKMVAIDQSPIGRTPRSNPATYTGLFTTIRELMAQTPEARARGYQPGRFSFNVKGGRCEACEGDGLVKVEMHFLADIYVKCDVCHGKRYSEETLQIHYKGKNIFEILDMTIEDALTFFEAIPTIHRKLSTLMEVGLSYLQLGQSATTLSGGEAQRIKLAKELSKRDTGSTLYILDEPTTGLHFHDVFHLLEVLNKLKERGNTLVVIEHNLDVIKTADWIIDLGPEGGNKGGTCLATGTPETIAKVTSSYTGNFLEKML